MRIIPIIHCFNSAYTLPAAVAFHSLLSHAKAEDTRYLLGVIAGDLTEDDKTLLKNVVDGFAYAELRFFDPPVLDERINGVVKNKSWSSALTLDLFNKLSVPDILPEYDLAIVADVDVIYEDDIAKVYEQMEREPDIYVAGGRDLAYSAWRGEGLFPRRRKWMKKYFQLYSEGERARQIIGAGLMVFNLKKIREDGIVDKWLTWARENVSRLILPEQDIINQVCYPRIKPLPWNHMAIAPFRYRGEGETVAEEMFTSSIQLHFSTANKPWKSPSAVMSEKWFEACKRADVFPLWKRYYSRYLKENNSAKTLPLYWTKGRPNFGDSVTPELMGFLLGRKVSWATKWKTKALTIGSILGPTLLKDIKPGIGGFCDRLRMRLMTAIKSPVMICGAGFLSDPREEGKEKRRRTKAFALRGKLSAEILKSLGESTDGIVFGDPGVLFDFLWSQVEWTGEDSKRRAYIPHESHWGTPRFEAFMSAHPELHYIDVRKEPRRVFEEIATMAEIFSASLHGLIAADSLGIPNRWVDLEIEGKDAAYRRFKFDDYYSAYDVKRNPIMLEEVPTAEVGEQVPRERIEKIKLGLLGAFSKLKECLG